MALTTGTIHDVLARRNPTLDVKTKKGANTKDPGWEMVVHKDLRPWRDFNYQRLINGWGHILSIEGARGRFEEEISDSQREIIDEDKIDSVAEMWNVECLRDPLKRGAACIRRTTVPDITIKKKFMQHPRADERPLEPDMAIFLKDGSRTSSTTLVMGENKCATKWTHLGLEGETKKTEALWPVRQIVTYCVHVRTRYGWIMTSSEVVVFRVTKKPGVAQKNQANHLVEWNFVPWSNNGEGDAYRKPGYLVAWDAGPGV